MKNQLPKTDKQNIAIQGVSDSVITLNINGEIKKIPNDVAELKAVLEKLNSPKVQVGEKIYNIGEIGQAEFKTIVNQYQQESKKSFYLRLFLFVFIPALAIGFAFLLYHFRMLQQPIVFTVRLHDVNPNPYIPLQKANITLNYSDKTESRQADEEAVFKAIPANLRNKPISIEARAEGFVAFDTTLRLSQHQITIPMRRNQDFAKLFGIVKDADNGERLADVLISLQDISTQSDSAGRFSLLIPPEKQRKKQRVRAIKRCYEEWDRSEEPINANVETIIRLHKKE